MDYLKKLKIQSFGKLLFTILLCALIGFACIAGSNLFAEEPEAKYLWDVPRDELEGAYVTVNLDYIYGCYAFTEVTEDGRATGRITEREYLIDANNEDYMALIVSGDMMDKAEKLLEQSDQYYYGEIDEITASFVVTGKVTKMPSDSIQLLYEYVDYHSLTSAEQDIFLTLALKPADYSVQIAPLAFGLVFLMIAAVLLVLVFTGHYQKQVREKLLQMFGANTNQSNEFMRYMLETLPEYKGLRIGRGYLLARFFSTHILFDSNDLVWAYKQVTRQKLYGIIPIGKSFSLMLCTADGKSRSIAMSEKKVTEQLQLLTACFPNTVIGYSDQLAAMYRNNRAAMPQVAAAQRANNPQR